MSDKKDGSAKEKISMAMPDNFSTTDDYQDIKNSKPKKLKIDENSYRPAKTRMQLYNELKKDEVVVDLDVYEYASYFERGAALALDAIFIFVLYQIVIFITPYEFNSIQYFLNNYNTEFIFGEAILLSMLFILTTITTAFIGVIIPMAFFNHSFGKKFLKLKVRGVDKYTISINEAIVREFFYKPISIISIAGFILPFYDKEKRSFHDKMVKTIVIKD